MKAYPSCDGLSLFGMTTSRVYKSHLYNNDVRNWNQE